MKGKEKMCQYKPVKPTVDMVKQFNRIWDGLKNEKDYQIEIYEGVYVDITKYLEDEIESLGKDDIKIQKYCNNNDIANFFSELNSIYHTRIKKEEILEIAAEWSLPDTTKSLDGLVELCKKKTKTYAYSFATKVFSFISPDKYPIMDRYVVNMLKAYNIKGISTWGDYDKYIAAYNEFKEKYELEFSYKKIDRFLWLYGKLIERYWKNEGVLFFDSTVWYKSKKKK